MKRFASPVLAAILAAACLGESTPPPAACDVGQFIAVSDGTTPTFTWDPCLVAALMVLEEATSDTLWSIETPGAAIASGVVYGQLPGGATQNVAPVALAAGTNYVVVVFRRVSVTGALQDFGASLFTP